MSPRIMNAINARSIPSDVLKDVATRLRDSGFVQGNAIFESPTLISWLTRNDYPIHNLVIFEMDTGPHNYIPNEDHVIYSIKIAIPARNLATGSAGIVLRDLVQDGRIADYSITSSVVKRAGRIPEEGDLV